MMDKYTKCILSVIAVCLIAIAIKLWEPVPAYSGFMDNGPTIGDFMNLKNLKGKILKKERERIIKNIPVMKVYRTVQVKVENIVEVSGAVDCY